MTTKRISQILDEDTSVPLKIFVSLMTMIIAATIWIMTTLYQIKAAQYDVVRKPDFRMWRDELAEMNPQFKIPYTDRRNTERAKVTESELIENCPE